MKNKILVEGRPRQEAFGGTKSSRTYATFLDTEPLTAKLLKEARIKYPFASDRELGRAIDRDGKTVRKALNKLKLATVKQLFGAIQSILIKDRSFDQSRFCQMKNPALKDLRGARRGSCTQRYFIAARQLGRHRGKPVKALIAIDTLSFYAAGKLYSAMSTGLCLEVLRPLLNFRKQESNKIMVCPTSEDKKGLLLALGRLQQKLEGRARTTKLSAKELVKPSGTIEEFALQLTKFYVARERGVSFERLQSDFDGFIAQANGARRLGHPCYGRTPSSAREGVVRVRYGIEFVLNNI